MDKLPQGDQKITIKINGEEKNYQEKELPIHYWQDADQEVAAARQEKSEIPRPPSNLEILRKKKGPKRLKIKPLATNRRQIKIQPMVLIASISAIAIGVLIGIIFLHVLNNETKKPAATPDTEDHGSGNEQPVTSEQTVLQKQQIVFIQEGVYKNEDAVKEHVLELQSSGKAAGYIKNGESIHVLSALVDSVDNGKAMLGNELYTDMWPKELEVPEKIVQNLTKDEKQFLESAFPFFEMLIGEGTKVFIQGDKYAGSLESLKTQHETLLALKDIKLEPIKNMQSSLSKAYEEMNTYTGNHQDENWLKSQNFLLQFLTTYYSM